MFDWFFNKVLNVIAKNKEKGSTNSEQDEQVVTPEKAQKARENLKLEIERFYRILENQQIKEQFDSLTNTQQLALIHRAKNNRSLRNFDTAMGGSYYGDSLAVPLIYKIISTANTDLRGDKLDAYIKDRLSGVDTSDEVAVSGDVTHWFDNATKLAWLLQKYSNATNVPFFEADELRNAYEQDVRTNKQLADKDSTPADHILDDEDTLDNKTDLVEQDEEKKTNESVNDNINGIINRALDFYKENPTSERKALVLALMRYVNSYRPNTTKVEQLDLSTNQQTKEFVKNLANKGIFLDNLDSYNKDRVAELFEKRMADALEEDTTAIFTDKRRYKYRDLKNLREFLAHIKSIYTNKLNPRKTNYTITYEELKNFKDQLDEVVDSKNFIKTDKDGQPLTDSDGNPIIDIEKQNELKDSLLYNAISKILDTGTTNKEIQQGVSGLDKNKLETGIKLLSNRINNIDHVLAPHESKARVQFSINIREQLNKDYYTALKEIQKMDLTPEQKKTLSLQLKSATDATEREILNIGAQNLKQEKYKAYNGTKRLELGEYQPSDKNKLFADTLLHNEITAIVDTLYGMQAFAKEQEKENGEENVYTKLLEDVAETDKKRTNALLKRVLENPIEIYELPLPEQKFVYATLVSSVFPKFRDLYNVDQDKDKLEFNKEFNKDFFENTGVYYDFTQRVPFNTEEATALLNKSDFLAQILKKMPKEKGIIEKLKNSPADKKFDTVVYSVKDDTIFNAIKYDDKFYQKHDNGFIEHKPVYGDVVEKPVVVYDEKHKRYYVCNNELAGNGYEFDPETFDVSKNALPLSKPVRIIGPLNRILQGDMPIGEEQDQQEDTTPETEDIELAKEFVSLLNNTKLQSDWVYIIGKTLQDLGKLDDIQAMLQKNPKLVDLLNSKYGINVEDLQKYNTVPTGEEPTPEENDEAKTAGFNFIGVHKTAAFFKFAESEDNYTDFDTNREDKEQGLIEGFQFDEENTEQSLKDDKEDSQSWSMTKLGKVFNCIKQESPEKWNDIKHLVQQSSAKVGNDLLTYLNLWEGNDWNAEKALRRYNEQAVDQRNRSYFQSMFERNVWPQIAANPSVVNAINKLLKSKPVNKSDVNTVEYK